MKKTFISLLILTTLVTYTKTRHETYKFEIKDDVAVVLKSESPIKKIGLELVKQVVSQIQGELTLENTTGLHYQIQFKNIVL